MTTREILIALYIECNGDWISMFNKITNKEMPNENIKTSKEFKTLCNSDNCVTIIDSNYPEKLKHSYKPPFVLVPYVERG